MPKQLSNIEFRNQIIDQLEQVRKHCQENQVSQKILDEINALKKMFKDEIEKTKRELSAQLSIYPLRQPSLSPTINQTLEVLEDHNLRVIPGSMSTLILGAETDLWEGLQDAYATAASQGEVVMILTISNACPKPLD
jgi:uncharacterized protein YqgV (UPF0045/DUF77 family)